MEEISKFFYCSSIAAQPEIDTWGEKCVGFQIDFEALFLFGLSVLPFFTILFYVFFSMIICL